MSMYDIGLHLLWFSYTMHGIAIICESGCNWPKSKHPTFRLLAFFIIVCNKNKCPPSLSCQKISVPIQKQTTFLSMIEFNIFPCGIFPCGIPVFLKSIYTVSYDWNINATQGRIFDQVSFTIPVYNLRRMQFCLIIYMT